MMKKLLSLFFSLILVCSLLLTPASAVETVQAEPAQAISNYLDAVEENLTTSDAAALGLAFMRYSAENENIALRSTAPMYDLDGNITAYCVDFQLNGEPSGYVIISMLHPESPFVEFSYFGEGPVHSLEAKVSSQKAAVATEHIIYLGTPFYYQQTSSTELTVYPGEQTVSLSAAKEFYYTEVVPSTIRPMSDFNFETIFEDMSETGLTKSDITFTDEDIWDSGSDLWEMDNFEEGDVCAPTAGTNIIWFWGDIKGNDWIIDYYTDETSDLARATDIFYALKDLMLTLPGGTWDMLLRGAYRSLLDNADDPDYRGTWSVIEDTSPSYSEIASDVDDGYLIHTCLREEGLWAPGHDVMTCGYAENDNGDEYLLIFDGWNRYGRFVIYDNIPQVSLYVGVRVN